MYTGNNSRRGESVLVVARWVSLTVFLAEAVALFFSIAYLDMEWLLVAVNGLLATGVSEALKRGLKDPRPINACNCNFLNLGGSVGGRPGMPSGHMATAVAIAATLWSTKLGTPMSLALFIVWVVSVAWSRVVLGCHTMYQVGGGALVGLVLVLLVRYLY